MRFQINDAVMIHEPQKGDAHPIGTLARVIDQSEAKDLHQQPGFVWVCVPSVKVSRILGYAVECLTSVHESNLTLICSR